MVKRHYQLNKTLLIDKEMCGVLLKNKEVFGKMLTKNRSPASSYILRTRVVGRPFRVWTYRATSLRVASSPCMGENAPGYFAYEVKKMTYLSQFLASLAAWRAKRNNY